MKRVFFNVFFLLLSAAGFAQDKQLKTKTEIRINPNGDTAVKIIEKYNREGFMFKRSVYKDGTLHSYKVYSRDTTEHTKTDTSYTADSEIKYIWKSKRNEHGDAIREERIYPGRDKKYVDLYDYTYDDSGNVIQMQQLDEDSTVGWEVHQSYNTDGQRIRRLKTFEGEKRKEEVYKYANGNQTDEMHYTFDNGTDKSKVRHYKFHYDQKGRMKKKTVHSTGDHLEEEHKSIYRFKYNKNGQLTSETVSTNGKPDHKTFYRYSYY